MAKAKLLLITFDYELFLGEQSGAVTQCLINPTDRLLASLNSYGLKALFFIDTVYLSRLKEMAENYSQAKADLDNINRQLIKIVKEGHEIHPHIHPHWMDAIYDPENREWQLMDKSYYAFSSLQVDKQAMLFEDSMKLIRKVLEEADSKQPVDAYRAGGWSIQPFSHFKPFFIQHGITHDWSVIPGRYHFSDAHSFDFRQAPAEKPVYRFSEDVCLEDKNGRFTEWTISTLTLSRFEKWIDFKISGLIRRLRWNEPLKGSTVSSVTTGEGDIYNDNIKVRMIASFEGLNPYRLRQYLAAIKKTNYFQFISHPKLITNREFKMIGSLFKSIHKIGDIETDFRKFVP